MTVALLFPVMDRPHRVEPLLANIKKATPEPHTILFAASDQPTVDELDRLGAPYVRDTGDTWPNRINALFRATSEPYVFLGADDVLFYAGWLPLLLRAQEEMAPIGGVVVPNDLHNPCGTLALVSRAYIDEMSGCVDTPAVVAYPGYRHNWSDTELFEVAKRRLRHRYVPGSVVEHLHPCAGKNNDDATYAKGHASFETDHQLHLDRMKLWS